jgi:hypothetical protein
MVQNYRDKEHDGSAGVPGKRLINEDESPQKKKQQAETGKP